jgi:hypothetical protein
MTTEVYDDGVTREAHSTKGASSAERWMNCPGSSALIAAFDLPETDEPSYRREGTAMHEAAADCLMREIDTWEIAGETYNETVITADMAEAIQVYLDRVRPSGSPASANVFVEAKLAAPDVHAKMFGSVDYGALVSAEAAYKMVVPKAASGVGFLDVTDLKGGEGIIVDPEDNAQMKYYAFMLIHVYFKHLKDDFPVRLTIAQPRAFSHDGPIREWWTTVGAIKAWVVRDLLPAMNSTENDLEAGKWCRFCPAKLACPLMNSLFRAAAEMDPTEVVDLDDESLGRSFEKTEAVKFYLKALEDETYRRLMLGNPIAGAKLVNKKANRVFKETVTVKIEGEDTEVPLLPELIRRFGKAAYDEPKIKSPAELEKVGPAGKEFCKEYAYMPTTGLTVAFASDKRTAVKVQAITDRFAGAIAANT